MPAYLIVDTEITDPVAYEDYKALARPLGEKYGGVYRARGGAMDVLESDRWTPSRIVVIEFPSMDAARAFVDSADYAPVRAIRRANARCSMVLVEGL